MGQIVWLASYPKSGNTWMRVFLRNYLDNAAVAADINRLAGSSVSEANPAFFAEHDPRPPEELTAQGVQAMRAAVHQELAGRDHGLVLVKTHNARLVVHGAQLCTDAVTAGAIVIVRDPRDVAISYSHYGGLNLDATIGFMAEDKAALRSGPNHVFEYLSSWSAHVASWVAAPKRLLIRYEDMLALPEKSFARVVRFLGLVPDEARLRRAIGFSGFSELARQEMQCGYAAGGKVGEVPFFRQGKAGGWHGVLTQIQLARLEADHGPMMRNFGYLQAAES